MYLTWDDLSKHILSFGWLAAVFRSNLLQAVAYIIFWMLLIIDYQTPILHPYPKRMIPNNSRYFIYIPREWFPTIYQTSFIYIPKEWFPTIHHTSSISQRMIPNNSSYFIYLYPQKMIPNNSSHVIDQYPKRMIPNNSSHFIYIPKE